MPSACDPMEFEIDEPEKVVYVVGIGPGDVYYLTQEAQNVLEHADAICGYKLYLDLIDQGLCLAGKGRIVLSPRHHFFIALAVLKLRLFLQFF